MAGTMELRLGVSLGEGLSESNREYNKQTVSAGNTPAAFNHTGKVVIINWYNNIIIVSLSLKGLGMRLINIT